MTDDEIPAGEAQADRLWLSAAFARMPPVTASPGLAARILAGFDAKARRRGFLTAWAETIWPGAPAWAPASVFALALMAGIGTGVALPSITSSESSSGFSLDTASSFDLVASDSLAGDVR